jgi:histidinol phosphatase-like PHP family hydrolase
MTGMYDLHTHTILSDGELLPIELIRRAAVLGYSTIGITDHVDASNISRVIRELQDVRASAEEYGVEFICGVEITHVPPSHIASLARRAKSEGAQIVIVHGESPVEPVAPGTNTAACSCDQVDILAHPGFISVDDAQRAVRYNVALEITSRCGHNRTNGFVVQVAREAGCTMVVNSDAHAPGDLMNKDARVAVARGAGMSEEECIAALSLDAVRHIMRQ